MNKILYIIFLFSNLIYSQDRTYLFYATPSGTDGWEISEGNSFSEKFPITTYPLYDDYFLEKTKHIIEELTETGRITSDTDFQIDVGIIKGEKNPNLFK